MQFDMNSGKPIPLSELKYRLLELNQNGDIPFSVIEQEDTLVASWNIVDAKWVELFGIGGLRKQYELTLRFDETKHRVSYREKSTDIETEISTGRAGFKKQVQWGGRKEFSFGKSWGIKTDGTIGEEYSYKFSTSDIKNPVFGIVNNSGWELQKSLVDKYGSLFPWLILIAIVLLGTMCYLA
ncbi:hypothetical protein QL189_20250 [Cronobacter turicensis]|uniref:hypothetical protein n=1 Tax=Cronobacter turicensis TaxID=413502 RepID=UPI001D2229B4|nr:hypothetical protein [Cronobacter turicensis]EGT4490857.1 hypothetical protein [Cronobacter turicensis]EKM0436629.1 hypothetical protein [Cronobacter turicensis]ELY4320267.1 hypothetical protein [Cronobacter turicensis]ELY5941422.1 hypothetical protein [Cronobacter turicensis]ELY5964976.1 hypothetical protein [Cronobacter turicensis]